jgi:hypothetical protein
MNVILKKNVEIYGELNKKKKYLNNTNHLHFRRTEHMHAIIMIWPDWQKIVWYIR